MTRHVCWLVAIAVCLGIGGVALSPALADGGKEKKVTIDQVPAAVKATILKEAAGNKIDEIEEVTKGNVVVYEAEWKVNGKEVEITVAADGKLLKKEIDDEDDDNEDDDNEDDDDD